MSALERIEANREEIIRCRDNYLAAKHPGRDYWSKYVDRYLDHELMLRTLLDIEGIEVSS